MTLLPVTHFNPANFHKAELEITFSTLHAFVGKPLAVCLSVWTIGRLWRTILTTYLLGLVYKYHEQKILLYKFPKVQDYKKCFHHAVARLDRVHISNCIPLWKLQIMYNIKWWRPGNRNCCFCAMYHLQYEEFWSYSNKAIALFERVKIVCQRRQLWSAQFE